MERAVIVRWISGFAALAAGAMLLLNSIGLIDIDWVLKSWWPIIFVIAGLVLLLSSLRSWIVASFLIILGTAYQLEELNLVGFEPWQLVWPAILILVGMTILVRGFGRGGHASDSERQEVMAIVSGSRVVSTSPNFKEANITALMGGAQLDLRKAGLADQVTIDVFTFWGGVEIIVPEDVLVENKTLSIMAGVEDQTSQALDKKTKTVTVKGMAIMGGVSIRNTPQG